MSSRSGHHQEHHKHHHPQDHGRTPARRPAAHHPAPAAVAASGEGYTLVHAGKQVRFGPVVFWIIVGTVVLLGMWSAATATYFAFRDDVLTRLIARQAEMQYAYEDRISELRAKVDRTTSRQLLDQEQFDQKLDQIMRRQSTLESRATALGAMPDVTSTGSIKPQGRAEAAPTSGPLKPSPISDTVIFVAPPDREARLESRAPLIAKTQPNQFAKAQGVDNVLVRLQTSLDQVERRQVAALASVEDSIDSKVRRMRGVISDLGLNMAQLEAATPRSGMGGPFVPVKLSADAGAFERQLYRININRAQMQRLNQTLALVPYRKPVVGEVEFTSGFGVRTDPFLGRPAMHTGLDFRAAQGDPVRVTANGKVVSAGWAGGYGRMVEVDHGNGLSTRYGHLSEIGVKVGEYVKIGQVIGAVGSTGRSTGPHLHYETRIDGEAVDPQKFLRAGVRLSAG
ncbi:murein DD-endopeptidase MepM/ murein hydrolase activator NlpD [Bradyrhizobium japonicum]|jgi:murein DD-endopeptidase MepM/ murein hydrolase activator NlpD|uniref:M23 family metallopeptidase n=1 Tax=Bradyrhizobium TaxID=374 RepID=UPI000477D5D5|nr:MULTISPECIES: M23 family metallopeptidase [Bradyrhizobium]MCP1730845.1 murein DD-endopeptidase MepM/ murein hydrolase activator NlpD [Bradyrhizobium elkanii]MCP1931402.1 murein DD-endopeptidase MepM/ murein hydrolase activator NlpD [Bradyrhizobium elkanii]MCS3480473.1 murein DD-endopeptidase MepM/ murein hydrolase activator NlpD [Bradyrhizobium elkanii]MCS3517279.1 murein DD-endopeptidase MepM/ murein hydrolase activator NlpD [Bradyrhizobium elkanii]MCS3574974.1 murein DD-endopeptidase MepM